jgi:phage-related protein
MEGQVVVMLILKTDGTLEPLGLKWTGESRFELLPPTRENKESVYADGEIDFGTELETGEMELHCVSDEGLTKAEITALKAALVGQLNSLRSYNMLIFESDSDKALYVRLARRPEITDYPGWLEVALALKYKPFWVSADEQNHVGSGTVANKGTVEAPLIVEVSGPVSNPVVFVGDESLEYAGELNDDDVLYIDTGKKTVKLNSDNALGNYNGAFPLLAPGGTKVKYEAVPQTQSVDLGGVYDGKTNNAVFRWRHCWI